MEIDWWTGGICLALAYRVLGLGEILMKWEQTGIWIVDESKSFSVLGSTYRPDISCNLLQSRQCCSPCFSGERLRKSAARKSVLPNNNNTEARAQ